MNDSDIDKLQVDLDRIEQWAVENLMKINQGQSNVSRVKDPLNYYLGDQRIPEASNCIYLGINLRSDLSWADQVNYTVQRGQKALHFVMCVFKKGNSNTKSLAYMSDT